MNRSFFMTGGTGFFGKSILSMMKRGAFPEYRFTILSRDPDRFFREYPEFAGLKQISFVPGDVRDFQFPKGHFDSVIHAGTTAAALPPGESRDVILRGMERILAFARQCGAEKLLFTSSGAVYGTQPPDLERIPETFPCCPETEYGIAKREAEEMGLASDVPVLIARCFAFTGPYLNRNIHFAIGNFIRDALAGGPVTVNGDGTPFRSYLYADDLAEWLFTILEKGIPGVPYNVGSEEAVSIRELAETVSDVLHIAAPVRILGTPDPARKPARYVPDTMRARSLGLSVRCSLREAIRRSCLQECGCRIQFRKRTVM